TKYERDMSIRKSDTDAAIWMLQPETLNKAQGYGAVFPSLNAKSLSHLVEEAFKDMRGSKSNLKGYDVIAAVPVNQDLRMVMQHGAFTIHANDVALGSASRSPRLASKDCNPQRKCPGDSYVTGCARRSFIRYFPRPRSFGDRPCATVLPGCHKQRTQRTH